MSQLEMPKKVAIYVRVSTHWQVDKDSLSVQKRELISYANLILSISENEVFEDAGYSAKNTDRPAFQSMMSRIRKGEFSHLLVWKIDRISRNLLDFASMYAELKQLGVAFVSKNEQFDTSTAIGEAMLKIILVFAELERCMTSERVSAVMLSRANNGQWNGGRVPYGYNWDKESQTFSFNREESEIVKKIYELYTSNKSTLFISRHLNASGIRTRNDNEWSPTVVHKILTNSFYIGEYTYKTSAGDIVLQQEHHIPLIKPEDFELVKKRLARNKRGGNKLNISVDRKNVHLFSGLLTCAHCGGNMSATLDRRRANGMRPSVYGCGKKRAHKCESKYVSDITIGPFVLGYISNIIKACGNSSERTSLETLERKLLKGSQFENVQSVSTTALETIKASISAGKTGLEFKPPSVSENGSRIAELLEEQRKLKRAEKRLLDLYLYVDEDRSESLFLSEKRRISDRMAQIESEIASSETLSADDEADFIALGSYVIMVKELTKNFDYTRLAMNVDKNVPKEFIRQVVKNIAVEEGLVKSIEFKNGVVHSFEYKNKPPAVN